MRARARARFRLHAVAIAARARLSRTHPPPPLPLPPPPAVAAGGRRFGGARARKQTPTSACCPLAAMEHIGPRRLVSLIFGQRHRRRVATPRRRRYRRRRRCVAARASLLSCSFERRSAATSGERAHDDCCHLLAAACYCMRRLHALERVAAIAAIAACSYARRFFRLACWSCDLTRGGGNLIDYCERVLIAGCSSTRFRTRVHDRRRVYVVVGEHRRSLPVKCT